MKFNKIKGNRIILMPFNAISAALSVVLCDEGYEVSFFDNNDRISGKTFQGCRISTVEKQQFNDSEIIVCSYRSIKALLAQLSGLLSENPEITNCSVSPYTELLDENDCDLLINALSSITEKELTEVSQAHCEVISDSGKISIRAGLASIAENTCNINHLAFIITELCTLRCMDCASWMQYIISPKHYTLQKILDGLNALLNAADYLLEVGVQGGEPLIHKAISDIINTLCKSNKVGKINLLTNATLVPTDDFLQSVNKYDNFCVRVSDYGDLSAKKLKVQEACQNNGVRCVTLSDMTWYYGPVITQADTDYGDVKTKYADCQMTCGGLAENLFSKCQNALFAHLLKAVPPGVEGEDSVIDVCADDFSKEKLKRHLDSAIPLKACWVCSGKTRAGNVIPTAVQTDKFTPYTKYE